MYLFNGSGNYITFPAPTYLPQGDSSRTVSYWIRPKARTTDAWVFYYGDVSSNNAFGVTFLSATSGQKISVWGHTHDVNGSVTLNDGQLYHVVCTYDSATSTLKTYINNVVDIDTTTTDYATGDGEFRFGNASFESTYYYPGGLYEVKVFDRALSSTEVATLYGGGSVTSGLVFNAACDEPYGAVCVDSVSGNNGTIYGATTNFFIPISVLLQDNFTDTDNVLLKNHAPDVNNTGDIWHDANDNWKISSNQLIKNSGDVYTTYINIGVNQFKWTGKLYVAAGDYDAGIHFRRSGGDGLFFQFHSSNYIWLRTLVGYFYNSTLVTTAWTKTTGWKYFTLTVTSTHIKLEFDGLVIEYDSTLYNTQQSIGLANWAGCSPKWESFLVSKSLPVQIFPQSFKFNSAYAEYLNCGTHSEYDIYNTDATFSFWRKSSDVTSLIVIMLRGWYGSGGFYIQQYTAGEWEITHNTSGAVRTSGAMAGTENQWHHWTFKKIGGGTWHIYKDGVECSYTYNNASDPSSISWDLIFGSGTGSYVTNSNLCDFRWWNRALTDPEILAVVRGKNVSSGLIGWWKLQELEGTNADDSSTSGFDGTITGASSDLTFFSTDGPPLYSLTSPDTGSGVISTPSLKHLFSVSDAPEGTESLAKVPCLSIPDSGSSPLGYVYQDTFTDPDNTLLINHIPNIDLTGYSSGGHAWQDLNSIFKIVSNKLTSASVSYCWCYKEYKTTSQIIEFDLTRSSMGAMSFCVRGESDSFHSYIRFDPYEADLMHMTSVVNNVLSSDTTYAYSWQSSEHWKVEITPTHIKLTIAGTVIIDSDISDNSSLLGFFIEYKNPPASFTIDNLTFGTGTATPEVTVTHENVADDSGSGATSSPAILASLIQSDSISGSDTLSQIFDSILIEDQYPVDESHVVIEEGTVSAQIQEYDCQIGDKGALIFDDSCTDTDFKLLDQHVPETGNHWVDVDDAFHIKNNTIRARLDQSSAHFAVNNVGSGLMVIEFDWNDINIAKTSPSFRSTVDIQSCYYLTCDATHISLNKHPGAVGLQVKDSKWVPGRNKIRIYSLYGKVLVFVNGRLTIDYTVSGGEYFTNSYIGLWYGNGGTEDQDAIWDNFKVYRLGQIPLRTFCKFASVLGLGSDSLSILGSLPIEDLVSGNELDLVSAFIPMLDELVGSDQESIYGHPHIEDDGSGSLGYVEKLSDSFTGSSWLRDHTPDVNNTGDVWHDVLGQGFMRVKDGKVYNGCQDFFPYQYNPAEAFIDHGYVKYSVEFDYAVGQQIPSFYTSGIFFRWKDPHGSATYLNFHYEAGHFGLDAGAAILWHGDFPNNTTYRVNIFDDGDNVSIWIDGIFQVTVVTSYNKGYTKLGFWAPYYDSTVWWDNMVINGYDSVNLVQIFAEVPVSESLSEVGDEGVGISASILESDSDTLSTDTVTLFIRKRLTDIAIGLSLSPEILSIINVMDSDSLLELVGVYADVLVEDQNAGAGGLVEIIFQQWEKYVNDHSLYIVTKEPVVVSMVPILDHVSVGISELAEIFVSFDLQDYSYIAQDFIDILVQFLLTDQNSGLEELLEIWWLKFIDDSGLSTEELEILDTLTIVDLATSLESLNILSSFGIQDSSIVFAEFLNILSSLEVLDSSASTVEDLIKFYLLNVLDSNLTVSDFISVFSSLEVGDQNESESENLGKTYSIGIEDSLSLIAEMIYIFASIVLDSETSVGSDLAVKCFAFLVGDSSLALDELTEVEAKLNVLDSGADEELIGILSRLSELQDSGYTHSEIVMTTAFIELMDQNEQFQEFVNFAQRIFIVDPGLTVELISIFATLQVLDSGLLLDLVQILVSLIESDSGQLSDEQLDVFVQISQLDSGLFEELLTKLSWVGTLYLESGLNFNLRVKSQIEERIELKSFLNRVIRKNNKFS